MRQADTTRRLTRLIDRRAFLGALGLLAAPVVVEAQPAGKVYRVGIIGDVPACTAAFRSGLRALGWIEGQNIALEIRSTGGRFESHASIAADFVRLPVDVIVAGGSESVQAARAASSSIPIVMTLVGDPVERGFIASFTRPGGNITGLANLSRDLDAKRLELLKETHPRIEARRRAVEPTTASPQDGSGQARERGKVAGDQPLAGRR